MRRLAAKAPDRTRLAVVLIITVKLVKWAKRWESMTVAFFCVPLVPVRDGAVDVAT
jgi:hypothetical protein